jgi:hypothetical protein
MLPMLSLTRFPDPGTGVRGCTRGACWIQFLLFKFARQEANQPGAITHSWEQRGVVDW